jgi:hypothetical protein
LNNSKNIMQIFSYRIFSKFVSILDRSMCMESNDETENYLWRILGNVLKIDKFFLLKQGKEKF